MPYGDRDLERLSCINNTLRILDCESDIQIYPFDSIIILKCIHDLKMLLILNSGIARVETIWPSTAGIQVNVAFDNNAQQVEFIYSGIQQEYNLAIFTWYYSGFYAMPHNLNQTAVSSFKYPIKPPIAF